MRRLHYAAIALLILPGAGAAQEVFIRGLEFRVLDVAGTTRDVAGTVRDISAEPRALVLAARDLVFAERMLVIARTVTIVESETEIRIALSADMLFGFDSAEIGPAAEAALTEAASVLRKHPDLAVAIEGHTDALGTDEHNTELSRERAEAVVNWLVEEADVDPARLQAAGKGKTEPVAPDANPDGTDNPQGRAENRRVEIVLGKD
jgi:outer membrane protein OmpA-like peptidoglycan-associated protein